MMTAKLIALLKDESGATAIEYGLMTAMVGLSALVGMMASGDFLSDIFEAVSEDMQAAVEARQQ
ncbi:MAG: Flp family type IVb pilin [Reyranellaceae bacterium]